jgi:hypothetical protein
MDDGICGIAILVAIRFWLPRGSCQVWLNYVRVGELAHDKRVPAGGGLTGLDVFTALWSLF